MSTALAKQSEFAWTRGRVALLAAAGFVVLAWAIASIGGPLTPLQASAAVTYWILVSSWAPALYIMSGIGLGRAALRFFAGAKERWAIQAAVGLSIQLTVGHAINCAGVWLPGVAWNLVSLVPGVVGLALLVTSLRTGDASGGERHVRPGAWMLGLAAGGLALAVMVVAACEAPGVLWASEFGGFDVLSYHLQLPREWLEMGRLSPVTHNVYSYLPSYFESAFLTLQLWTFAPRTTADSVSGILAGDGWRALSCQMLHVGFGVVAAWMVAAGTRELVARTEIDGEAGDLTGVDAAVPLISFGARHRTSGTGWIGAACFLSVPWVVVVGSMAYNELAMCALFAGAMVVACDRGLTAIARGVLAGWLLGVACGLKPTAIVLAAPATGVALLWFSPLRSWVVVTVAALVAGAAALAPWMIRNWIACGNPVFPYVHGLFGDAHWTAEQYARFAGAHHFGGTWADRLRLLFLIDPTDPAGARHRGMMHPQWSVFFPLVGVAGVLGLAVRSVHRVAAMLVIGILLQVAAWLTLTHLQSRFLLPLAVPGATVVGVVGSGLWITTRLTKQAHPQRSLPSGRGLLSAGLVPAAVLLCAGFMSMRSLDAFWSERGGSPNRLLAVGPEGLARRDLRIGERAPVKPGEKLYLLGDSAAFYFPGPLVYHTTWDSSPLGEILRGTPSGAIAWSEKMRERGIGAVLVNPGELDRLIGASWYDPAVTLDVVGKWLRDGATVVPTVDETVLVARPREEKR